MFADDIALFAYSPCGLQKQLDILSRFCAARGLTVNVNRPRSQYLKLAKAVKPPSILNGDVIDQLDEFKYFNILMH